jgi:hypothetical protein
MHWNGSMTLSNFDDGVSKAEGDMPTLRQMVHGQSKRKQLRPCSCMSEWQHHFGDCMLHCNCQPLSIGPMAPISIGQGGYSTTCRSSQSCMLTLICT